MGFDESLEQIKRYYGQMLQSSADLKTSACCIGSAPPAHVAAVLDEVHEEVKNRFYGCGSPTPPALDGVTVLDLGCGSGRDCYVLSKLVGPRGRVIGVDMTDEQLAVALRHRAYHAEKFGHDNVDFRRGYIEELASAGLADSSVDLVVSNCVLNLSPDKRRAFREAFRVLKPGGEFYFSDVFADRRIPDTLRADPVLRGECLGGALYIEDFRRRMAQAGCLDARVVSSTPLAINNPEVERRIGFVKFSSVTVRAFKLALEDRCEDFGQIARYLGTLPGHPHAFDLDDHHRFETGKFIPVCGNTAEMLTRTRYAPHFRVLGDGATHFGLFDCGSEQLIRTGEASAKAGCC